MMKKRTLLLLIMLILVACSSKEKPEIETYEEEPKQQENSLKMFSNYVVDPQSAHFNYLLREDDRVIVPYYRENNKVNMLALDLMEGSYELLYSDIEVDPAIIPEWPKLFKEEQRILMKNFQGYFFIDENGVIHKDDRFADDDQVFYIDENWYIEKQIADQEEVKDFRFYPAKDFYNRSILVHDPQKELAYLTAVMDEVEVLSVFDDASALVYEKNNLRSDPKDVNAPQIYDAYLKKVYPDGQEEILASYEALPNNFSQHFYSYHQDKLVVSTPDRRMHHFNRQGEKTGEYPSFETSGMGSYAETRFLGSNEKEHFYWMSILRSGEVFKAEKVIVKIPKDSDAYEDFRIIAAYDEAQISGGSPNISFDQDGRYVSP